MAASASAGGMIGSAQTDITNPYETFPCGCLYCFVCLVQKLEGEEGEGWVCLRCGEIVKKCKPWNGDVLEEVRPQATSGKAVGFAIDGELDTKSVSEEQPLDDELEGSRQWTSVDKESVDENDHEAGAA